MYKLYFRGDDRVAPREFAALTAAMTSIGWTGPADWLFAQGRPDAIYSYDTWSFDQDAGEAGDACWVIEAAGAARELISMLPAAALTARCPLTGHADLRRDVAAWMPGAAADAALAAARLTAWYAVAGYLTWRDLAEAARTGLPGAAGPDIDDLARQLSTVAAVHDVPVMAAAVTGRLAVASAGPGKPVYVIRRRHNGESAALGGPPLFTSDTLTGAMKAAGYPEFADWDVASGQSDALFSASGTRPFYILEAPGVAREYARACPHEVRAGRYWSGWDNQIIQAVLAVARDETAGWRLPAAQAHEAALMIAALFGTGPLTPDDVCQALCDVDRRLYGGDPAEACAALAGSVAAELAAAGVPFGAPGWAYIFPADRAVHVYKAPAVIMPRSAHGPPRRLRPGPAAVRSGPLTSWLTAAVTRADRGMIAAGTVLGMQPVWMIRIPAGRTPRWICRIAAQALGLIRSSAPLIGGLWATWLVAGGPLGLRSVPGCYIFHPEATRIVTPCPEWTGFWDWHSWVTAWATAWANGLGPLFLAWLLTWFLAAAVVEKLVGLRVVPRRRDPGRGTPRRVRRHWPDPDRMVEAETDP